MQKTVEDVPQLHQLLQHRPELGIGPVEQPLVDHEQAERPVLPDELALAARALPALPPEVLEVGLPDVARPHPPGAGGLRERAGEVGLARARAGDNVLRQPVHRPRLRTSLALILLAMWSLLVHSTAWQPERNGGGGDSFNGGVERQYSSGWTAVPIRNTSGAERA